MRMMLESLQVLCDPSHFTPEMLKETMRNSYEAISQSLWRAVVFANLLKDLSRILVPTLIIRGEHDIVVPQDWTEEAVAKIPNAQLVLIKNASHLALIEQPNQFNQAVSQFLQASE
jgi:pimeloyl-ACP methyl ester carboxylesterase